MHSISCEEKTMKHTAFFLLIVAAGIVSCSSPEGKKEATAKADSVVTAAPAKETPPPPMDSATIAKKEMESMTPGEMHKMLASSDGKWETDVTSIWEPGKPPEKSKGTVENKMILGGRYQQSVHKGMMMGMPFEGMSITGYDNAKKMFVSTWVDNMGTGIIKMEGPYDAATKTIEMKGKCTDPISGRDFEMRETFKIIDDKSQYTEMFMTHEGGKEMKVMEMKLAKK